jgi:predicted NAD/FAD-binding protein
MFNASLWPNLSRLYQELGVETESVEPSKTFACVGSPAILKLGKSFQPKLAASLLSPAVRKIQLDIGRMLEDAPRDVFTVTDLTMEEYLKQNRYSEEFVYQFLFPVLSSTVCTCSYGSLRAFPAVTLLAAMLSLTGTEGLARTRHGTRDVVQRLSAEIDEIFLETVVLSVRQIPSAVEVLTANGGRFEFDHVLIATQANAAIRIVDGSSPLEQEMLDSFEYEDVFVFVHTDETLMPVRRKDWSNFNLLSNSAKTAAMCSIWMNRFYPEQQQPPLFQTIMPLFRPREERVVSSTKMQRPVVNGRSIQGLEKLNQIHQQPGRRIWYCGSYASPGVPLLESGVVSSLNVAKHLGINWPDPCSV